MTLITPWYSIKVEDLIKDENMMHYVKQICYHQFLGVGKFITGVRIFWCFKKFLFDSFFAFARTIFSNFTWTFLREGLQRLKTMFLIKIDFFQIFIILESWCKAVATIKDPPVAWVGPHCKEVASDFSSSKVTLAYFLLFVFFTFTFITFTFNI